MNDRTLRFAPIRERAIELSLEFERRSLRNYERGTFVSDNIRDLREAGITRLNVPSERGGLEATLRENVEVIRLIAKGCGSTAFTLAIHLILTGSLRAFAQEPVRSRVFDAVEAGGFVCGPFTDAQSGGNWTFPSTTAVRNGNAFVVNGVKHFFTGFEACTHMLVTAALQEEHMKPPFNLVGFFLEKPAHLDQAIVARWNAFAMPMTGSHSVEIRELPTSADDLVAPEGLTPLLVMSQQHWGHYCFAAVFLGLAERAYEIAVAATKGRGNNAVRSIATQPGVQFSIGRMRAQLTAMVGILEEYCESWAEPGDDLVEFVAATCIPKYFVTNEAMRVVQLAFEVLGGSGVREATRIGQIYRDVRAGALLPFNNDLCREFIGKQALGIDPTSAPRWL